MAWSPEISQLSTDVTQLTNEVNTQKNLLSGAVTSAQTSRITANTGAAIAESSVVPSTTNMLSANTFKNSTLSIYGTQAAQQASVTNAAGQVTAAAVSAITATTGLTQDLSGVTAQALHRSPQAITSMFVYDTSKDSDGGAWTERCQHTSWYNETIYGKWLGPQLSETYARYSNATLGSELITNGNFSNGSTGWTLSGFSIVDGVAVSNSSSIFIRQNVTTVPGKVYRVEYNAKLSASLVGSIVRLNSTVNTSTNVTGPTNAFGTVVEYVIAGSGTTGLEIITTAGSNIFSIDNVSLREVIAINTTSSDYFQLTTDGKFYRLWKNLLRFSDQVENAAWSKRGVTITPNAVAGPFAGTFGDSIYVATNFATPRDIRQSANMVAGVAYCYSAYIKAGTQNLIAIGSGNFNNFGGFLNLSTQVFSSVTPNTTTQIVSVGDGWYRVSISFVANTTVLSEISISMAGQDADADPTDFISVYGAQLEYGSTPTTYEAKTTVGTTSEVFRGNKRDFPRLAGIVCQSTGSNASQVAIYDLTEPGRPMWMAFVDYSLKSTVTKLLDWNGDDTGWSHVAMMNGWLVGTSNTSAGMCHFIKDWIAGSLGVEFSRNRVSDRNDVGTVTSTGRVTFNTAQNNSARTVRMLVEPNAPVEPDTGLQRPSVLIGSTQPTYNSPTGGSFLYHTTANYDDVVFFPRLIAARRGFNSFSPNFFYTINPGLSSAVSGEITATSAPDFALGGNTTKLIGATNGEFLRAPAASLVQKLKLNRSAVTKSLTTTIRDTFNTGWMPGDIRRAYLSDTETGSTTGPELVTNGTFNTNVSGWTLAGGTAFVDSSGATITTTAGRVTLSQTLSTTVGRAYIVTGILNNLTSSVGGAIVRITSTNSYSGTPVSAINSFAGGNIPFTFIFTSTANVLYIWLAENSATLGSTVRFDNISVREVVLDRSYKAQSASINGIVTRSQAAAGTSLVGYSGFSTTNYLQEPYSADLEFGNGEFSASAWVNIPTLAINPGSPPTGIFQVTGSNLVTNGAFDTPTIDWTAYGPAALSIVNNVLRIEKTSAAAPTDFGATLIINFTKPGTYRLSVVVNRNYTITNTTMSVAFRFSTIQTTYPAGVDTTVIVYADIPTAGQHSVTVRSAFGGGTIGEYFTIDNVKVEEVPAATIIDRAHSSGTRLKLAVDVFGRFVTEAFDGTTTRTVTTTATYNTAQWLKAEANYTTDGSLAIRVNGREVAVTRGNPLRSLNSRKNLLTYTESFDIAPWSNRNALSASRDIVAAPDGMATADSLIFSTNPNDAIQQDVTGLQSVLNVAFTFSVWLRCVSGTTTIRLGVTEPSIIDYTTVVTVTTEWQRFSFSQTFGSAGTSARVRILNNAAGTTGTVYAWGAQLEIGSNATAYQRVTTITDFANMAPLTIGNSFTANAPFPGSIALLKLGATVPTPEQSVFMYEQEKQLFRPGALSVLPDANAIIDMSYDDATDRWATVSTTNESYWNGLIRSSVTAVPAGSYSRVATTSGVELVATTTTNPGVYVSIPPYALREELVKRSEAAGKLVRKTVTYDYTGGFTGNITTGSTSIVSVAGLVYPTSYIGARISGTGIPANTVITGVSGTTIYISAPATATTNTLAITFLDFNLPVGMEAKVVLTAGVIRREGSTSDYTRLFDGFIETIRFAVAPGSTAWVQIQATRTAQ